MVSDRVGDFIIRLKNAGAINKPSVSVPFSKHVEEIAHKLKSLGYVADVEKGKKPYGRQEIKENGNNRCQAYARNDPFL